MKYTFKPFLINISISAVVGLASCKKESSLSGDTAAAIQAAVIQTKAVAIAANTTTKEGLI
jgi:hypothetical protein